MCMMQQYFFHKGWILEYVYGSLLPVIKADGSGSDNVNNFSVGIKVGCMVYYVSIEKMFRWILSRFHPTNTSFLSYKIA